MSTQFDSYPYHHRPSISPPVSPKTLPHGYKRKASTQDDEVESHSQISNSFKKLRLKDGRRTSRANATPLTHVNQEIDSHHQAVIQHSQPTENPFPTYTHDEDDYMGLDDTSDRVWIHDLDAEIKQIEAEEARHNDGMHIVDGGTEYSKVPDHVLRHNPRVEDAASNLQMVLYRDPISISVPQEEDAVRKAIIEARRRVREKQQEQLGGMAYVTPGHQPIYHTKNHEWPPDHKMGSVDGMDID